MLENMKMAAILKPLKQSCPLINFIEISHSRTSVFKSLLKSIKAFGVYVSIVVTHTNNNLILLSLSKSIELAYPTKTI